MTMPNARRITRPLTLRITDAEIVESQLQEDDLRALTAADGGGDNGGGKQCGGTYCETNYKSGAAEEIATE
jgi:hypothetical protein